MSIINNGLLLASGADAATTYQISRSLRFNSADSAYLSRTPGSAGNRRTFTVSCWVKRSALSSNQVLLSSNSNNSAAFELAFTSGDALAAYLGTGPNLVTSSVYRDCSAFYHIICAVDTTQSTASDRIKLYVNGTQITAFSASNYPSQNLQFDINNTTAHGIGRESGGTSYFNGYIADFYLLDGTATTPSTFAETDATTGQWIPKLYTGSYGTNGFRLTFSDNSGTTSTTLGKDAAGSNNWSPNNFSVASGSGNDSLTDSPTSYGTDTGAGNEVRGNYATLNPLVNISGHTFRNGNLEVVTSSSNYGTFVSTIAMPPSGKWYAEAYISATSGYPLVGIAGTGCTFGTTSYLGGQATMYAYYGVNGNKYNNGTSSSYGATYTTGDTIGIAYDADAGTITFYKNGVSQGQAYSGITSGSYYFAGNEFNSASGTQIWNFGQRAFAYTAPSGFKALCDTNLTAPTIAKPADYFDVKLYTGNGSSQSITGLQFSPDFVWLKDRTSANDHNLYDVVRGTNKKLVSNSTAAEATVTDVFNSFDSSGFSIGNSGQINTNNNAYVAWAWDAGSSNTTNNSGSITGVTNRVNASAGFSIVTYTGNGANATVGHGLGVAPSMAIVKVRNRSGENWLVYHKSLTTPATDYLLLSSTAASGTLSGYWNGGPTSTVIGLGNYSAINYSGDTYVAYCFAPVAGYSSFGSYVGNGSSDGVFVYLGFRPKWLMVKRTDAAEYWIVFDAVRNTYNIVDLRLLPSASNAEGSLSTNPVDFLSNGFKNRGSDTFLNGSGATYIYAAFAENPFQYARAR